MNILLKESNDKVQYQIPAKKVIFATSSLSCHWSIEVSKICERVAQNQFNSYLITKERLSKNQKALNRNIDN